MCKINLKYLLIAQVLISSTSIAQNTLNQLAENLAKSYLKENKNTGCVVIGLYDNGKEKIFYYGETEKGNKIIPDSNSIFEIGNLSETFTTLLFADRTWKGVMHIDDKLQDYLPVDVPSLVYQPVVCKPVEKQTEPDYPSRDGNMSVSFTPYTCKPDTTFKPQPMLLCYLASHTSGLPDMPGNLHSKNKSNPYADYSTNDLYDYLRKYMLEKQIGFDYKHSSLGIAILGKAISLRMKMPFEQALKECVLDSLKMNDTRISLNDSQRKRLLSGYNSKGTKVEYWTADVFSPVIGLHSTPHDMMTFLRANVSINKGYYTDLLNYTHNSRLKPGGVLSEDLEIAMGWKITPLQDKGIKAVSQSGHTGGFACFTGFVETSHTGVIIMTSVSADADGMGKQLLEQLQKEKL